MAARLDTLSQGIWNRNKSDPLGTQDCFDCKKVSQLVYDGFYGPFCEIGKNPFPPSPEPTPKSPTPGPPSPPAPGPFPPQPLSNCTYLPTKWISPASEGTVVKNAATKGACCKACGLDSLCVASVLKCPMNSTKTKAPCTCKLKSWNQAQALEPNTSGQHTTLACLTGRKKL
jgi:hypothetical protein